MSDTFEQAWGLMKWNPEQVRHSSLPRGVQGPPNRPLDAGLWYPQRAIEDPDWFHPSPFEREGKKVNQWDMGNDQDWAWNPFDERYIQVDRVMKPLLERFWEKGIDTRFSDTGGDLQEHPNAEHFEEMHDKSIYGPNKRYYVKNPDIPRLSHDEGYLYFGNPVPQEVQHFPHQEKGEYDPNQVKIDMRPVGVPGTIGHTLRWPASENLEGLRSIYEAIDAPFPEHLMEDGGIKWRDGP